MSIRPSPGPGPGGTAGETSADEPGVPVGQAAARVGVAPSTLRTWGRRYGVLPTGRSLGGHRRYSAGDIAVLERIHALTLDGVPPSRAALTALREASDAAVRTAGATPVGTGPVGTSPVGTSPVGTDPATAGQPPTAGPGGRVLAVPGAGPRAQGLARAATRLDVDAATVLLEEALDELGTLATYDSLLRPVLVAAGEAWARTGQGIEVEHLFSEAATEALRHHRRRFRERLRPGPPVLLACAPRDLHVIPLHVLAGALAERLVPSRILGQRVPPDALAAAVTRTGARQVFVWAQRPGRSLSATTAAVPTRRPPVRVVVGGPGWDDVVLPAGILAAGSAQAAVDLLAPEPAPPAEPVEELRH